MAATTTERRRLDRALACSSLPTTPSRPCGRFSIGSPSDFAPRSTRSWCATTPASTAPTRSACGTRRGDLPLSIVRHENLGYGGNQKSGYRWAIDHGLDIVVLLHGDGQYAPEVIEDLVAPLTEGRADAVFGSRMLTHGAARAGGMPLYKFAGNRILTFVQNALVGLDLSEWHSGYRAYRSDALVDIPFESYSDGFDFDTEIILGLHAAGKAIDEVPIPTYYGDEICYVNGVRYAKDVTADVVRYRLASWASAGRTARIDERPYELKLSPYSSHGVLLKWLAERPPGRLLDVGCSDGQFGLDRSVAGPPRHRCRRGQARRRRRAPRRVRRGGPQQGLPTGDWTGGSTTSWRPTCSSTRSPPKPLLAR